MPDERPCAVCGRKAEDMLGEDHCLGCHRDELLEALRRYVSKFGNCGDVYDQAVAAIAKAEGKD